MPPQMPSIRIFVSSPGDVAEERWLVVHNVIQRLQQQFAHRVVLEEMFWELEPLQASASFQDQIPRASEFDICLVLLWSRLGTSLMLADGSRYDSGTEFEFLDALKAFRAKGSPVLLVYRKTADRLISLDAGDKVVEFIEQRKRVQAFIDKYFRDADNVRAIHEFETPAQLEERLEAHLRKYIDTRLTAHDGVAVLPRRWTKGSPFRGLEPFDLDHALIFCGRTAAIHDVLNALRHQAADGHSFVLVTGMSGAGKSSLVRAGVLPLLICPGVIEGIRLWRHTVFRPTPFGTAGDLVDSLAMALLSETALPGLGIGMADPEPELAELLRTNPTAVPPVLKRELAQLAQAQQEEMGWPEPPEARLALVVDQLEEIFVQERVSSADRTAFMTALSILAQSGLVWIIATLRRDFIGRCDDLPELLELKKGAGQYDLRPPKHAEIMRMIQQPAQMAGLCFERRVETEEGLDDVLCAAAAKDPAALPLLEFTLNALYKACKEKGVLTFAAYDALGGLEGALATRAEEVFERLPPRAQEALPEVLAALVSINLEKDEEQEQERQKKRPDGHAQETGKNYALAQRRVTLDRVTADRDAKLLVEAFVADRLFVTDSAADGTPVLGVAHEALLRVWPRVQSWAEENRDMLRARAHLAAAAALWRSKGKAHALLLQHDKSLEDGRRLLARYGDALLPEERAFIAASLAASKRRRQQRQLVLIAGTAAGLVAITGFGWYWDAYIRTHYDYYVNMTERHGLYEGVGPVSENEMSQRNNTFRFSRYGRKGEIYRVEVIDGHGRCPQFRGFSGSMMYSGDLESDNERVCRWELNVTTNGSREERAFDRAGRELYKLLFSGPDTAEYVSNQGYAFQLVGSGASHLKFKWEDNEPNRGRRKIVHFTNPFGSPRPDRNGSFGVRYEYNDLGLPVRITQLDRNDRPTLTKNRVAILTIKYDEQGNPKEFAFLDETGKPTLSSMSDEDTSPPTLVRRPGSSNELRNTSDKDNITGIKLNYDSHGNITEIIYVDRYNKPTLSSNGYSRVNRKYDINGNLVEMTYSDEEGKPTSEKELQVSGTRLNYNSQGMLTEIKFLDEDGRHVRNAFGIATIKNTIDQDGSLAEQRYLDDEGNLTRNNNGYSIIKFTYNEHGKTTSESYFDKDDNHVLHTDGYTSVEWEYNNLDQKISEAYFDEKHDRIRRSEGYAIIRWTYNEYGNEDSKIYFNERFEKTPQRNGYAEVRWTYDNEGHKLSERYFDVESRLTLNNGGYAAVVYSYNEHGRMVRRAYLGQDGKPTADNSYNYAIAKYAYDERGNVTEESYFDENDKPKTNNDDYARVWRTYDGYDRLETETYYDNDNKQIPIYGCAQQRASYDDHEIKISCISINSNQSAKHKDGWQKQKVIQEERGTKTKIVYLTHDDKPITTEQGYASVETRRNTRGLIVEEAYFGESGSPVRLSKGYARLRRSYNDHGKQIEESYHDEAGRLVRLGRSSVAKVRWTYDERNRKLEESYFDEIGKRVQTGDGVAKVKWSYDPRSNENVIEVSFYDEADRPTSLAGVFANAKLEYDERGNVRNLSFYDEAGRPTSFRRERLPQAEVKQLVQVFELAANRGHTDAQNMLGWMYETGRGADQDYRKALRWYSSAAALRDPFGMSNLGSLYLLIVENINAASPSYSERPYSERLFYAEALRLFYMSANRGNPSGQVNLGLMYLRGWGIPQNPMEALRWFKRAADQGDPRGQSHLGVMYETGQGVMPDYAEAVRYYRLAAANGDDEGMTNLGRLYLREQGVKRDDAEALQLFRDAAEHGNPLAQSNLGWMYANGRGVRQDPVQAIRWYARAYMRGDSEVKSLVVRNLMALHRPDRIRAAQVFLTELQAGLRSSRSPSEQVSQYDFGSVDGRLSDKTRQAIRNFQQHHQIERNEQAERDDISVYTLVKLVENVDGFSSY